MSTENLAPQVITRILGEIRELVRFPPDGIEYLESEENSVCELYAMITGPEETPFVSGKFKVKLQLSEDYPNSAPKGFFLTKIYHPNVSAGGDICVNTLKKDWNSDLTIKHVLQVIRCLLIVPFPESSLNDEAGKLFMDSYEEYSRRARIMTEVHAISSLLGKDEESNDGGEDLTTANPSAIIDVDATATKQKVKDAKKKSFRRL